MSVTAIGERKMFIGGEWTGAEGGRTLPVVNPATEEIIATVPSSSPADVDRAVAAARDALKGPWGQMSARDRGVLIWKIGRELLKRADEVARLETLHNGKPIFESRQIDVPASVECFEYYAGWADKIHGETIPVKGAMLAYTLREPVGVVAAIVPWNFPLLLAVWKVAPALACGNTVILKPASQTPLTAIALAEIANDIGLPPGVFNVVTGPGAEVGLRLAAHPGVDKIAFTGHTSTGREIAHASADTVKRLTLELGGKSPNIVFADADLDAAVRGATIGIFYGKGEVCAAGSRLLVERSIRDEFLSKLGARAKKMVPGDPIDPKTRLGAVSSKAQLDRVLEYIETGAREGGAIVAGGHRADIGTGKGYFVEPTVFAQVTPEMTIAREEIFGPVLAVDGVQRPRGSRRAGEPLGVRSGRGRLDTRHQEGAPRRARAAGWHRVDQHLQRVRHGGPLRRLQAIRVRPGDGPARARELHAGQDGDGGSRAMIQTIAVLGAGTMGHGIAHAAIAAGFKTRLFDVSDAQLGKAVTSIEHILRRNVEHGTIEPGEVDAAIARLWTTTVLDDAVDGVDLVIEAVPERLDVKLSLLGEIELLIAPDGVIASNTSALSLTELASALARPARLAGMHFFNPVHKMKLVEIVRALDTDQAAVEAIEYVAHRMGKETVVVRDSAGFVTSRINALIGNEAFYLLQEGVASARDIDKALKLGLNHPMGPFELVDLVGLDIRLSVLEHLYQTLGEKYRPCPLLVQYVQAGRLGRKVGKGVYEVLTSKNPVGLRASGYRPQAGSCCRAQVPSGFRLQASGRVGCRPGLQTRRARIG